MSKSLELAECKIRLLRIFSSNIFLVITGIIQEILLYKKRLAKFPHSHEILNCIKNDPIKYL